MHSPDLSLLKQKHANLVYLLSLPDFSNESRALFQKQLDEVAQQIAALESED